MQVHFRGHQLSPAVLTVHAQKTAGKQPIAVPIKMLSKRSQRLPAKAQSFAIPSKRGNFVIGVCPSTETNVTLKTKCIPSEKHDVADYIWVSDESGDFIYQNEICALCHRVTKYADLWVNN